MRNVLILGGTGVMGLPLVSILKKNTRVYVTTRREGITDDDNHVTYVQGNAKNFDFLRKTLEMHPWDAVVDFMLWYHDYDKVADLILANTKQYVFISSSRVYANSQTPITENSPRLLEVCTDKDYLSTNEYALAKSKEEDILKSTGQSNYTIVRPYITYNDNRLQLGVYEKEAWLYRALHGRSIVFSKDLAEKMTTLTCGEDVAKGIASIIGNEECVGQIYHITSPHPVQWKEVLDIYAKVLEEHLGHPVNIVMTDKCSNFAFTERKYQIIYCRYFNRIFDNSKIAKYCNINEFRSAEVGLSDCLKLFLSNPHFNNIDWMIEGLNDRSAREYTPLSEIMGMGNRIAYLSYRFNCKWIYKLMNKIHRLVN